MTDAALNTIKHLQDATSKINGIVGWWKLGREVNLMTAQRMQSLANKIYAPKKSKKYDDVMLNIEEWEMNVKLYEKVEKHDMPEQTKIYSVRQIVQSDLEQDIVKNNTFDTYDKVKTYIIEQTSIKKNMKNHKNTGPASMELDMMNKLLAEINPAEN